MGDADTCLPVVTVVDSMLIRLMNVIFRTNTLKRYVVKVNQESNKRTPKVASLLWLFSCKYYNIPTPV